LPVYEYRALDAQGKVREGILDADTPREARGKLRELKVHVVDLRAKEDIGGKQREWMPRFLRRRHSEEVAGVTRQLATMLKSGIPLAQSLSALIRRTSRWSSGTSGRRSPRGRASPTPWPSTRPTSASCS
jgi:general secretion pathway protein F